MTWRNVMLIAGIIILAVVTGFWWLNRTAPSLTVATWAGTYGRAQASALFSPYSQKAWVDLRIAYYDGGLAELRGQVGARRYDWDVIDLELPDAEAACAEGLLETIWSANLPKGINGAPASEDFVPGAIGRCWVGSIVYSQVIGFSPQRFKGTPQKLADFFNVTTYPGPRGLRRNSAKLNLEMALLASGVKPADVYRTLSTPQGLNQAFSKLESIRPHIKWWSRSNEPQRNLLDGNVAFSTMPNRVKFDTALKKQVTGVIWDRQLYELDVFAIPKGNPKSTAALEFIRFATSSSALADVANWLPYGPARRSSVDLAGQHPEFSVPMRHFSPTAPEHFQTAFQVNNAWWAAHGSQIELLWKAWLDKSHNASN